MKRFQSTRILSFLLLIQFCLTACQLQTRNRIVQLIVSNDNDYDVNGVVNGISLQTVMDSLLTQDASSIQALDEQGRPVLTQIFDNGEQLLLLFECSALAHGESTYTLTANANQQSVTTDILPIAAELRCQQDIQAQGDSLVHLLDVSMLGGSLLPYPATTPRHPWNHVKLDVLAEGPLMCAYQLHYDTLYAVGDTLVEHRTLVMQRGSNLTIVRALLEEAAHLDTLRQLYQFAVTLPCQVSDSLIVDEAHDYLVIERNDTTALGLFVPDASQVYHQPDMRQEGFLLPFTPGKTLTWYVASGHTLTLPSAQKQLLQMHDAPLSICIVVHQ